MSTTSVLARVWAPAVLTAVSTVAVGFAINYLSEGAAPWWWWLVLGVGSVAGIAGAVLTATLAKDERNRSTPPAVGGDVLQQTATGGDNISIIADNKGVAAWQIGQVNMGSKKRNKP